MNIDFTNFSHPFHFAEGNPLQTAWNRGSVTIGDWITPLKGSILPSCTLSALATVIFARAASWQPVPHHPRQRVWRGVCVAAAIGSAAVGLDSILSQLTNPLGRKAMIIAAIAAGWFFIRANSASFKKQIDEFRNRNRDMNILNMDLKETIRNLQENPSPKNKETVGIQTIEVPTDLSSAPNKEMQQLQKYNTALLDKLKQLQGENQKLKEDGNKLIQSFGTDVSNFAEEIRQKENFLQDLQKKNDALKSEIRHLDREKVQLANRIEDLSEQLLKLNSSAPRTPSTTTPKKSQNRK